MKGIVYLMKQGFLVSYCCLQRINNIRCYNVTLRMLIPSTSCELALKAWEMSGLLSSSRQRAGLL